MVIQKIRERSMRTILGVSALAVFVALSGCAQLGDQMFQTQADAVDAGGMTREEALSLSLEEQFVLFGERNAAAEAVLTETQLVVSADVWLWGTKGGAPWSGDVGPGSLPGSNADNSYFLTIDRIFFPEGAVGALEDTEPMVAYFESKGWENTVVETYGDYRVVAFNGEGLRIEYWVQTNGQYVVSVTSEVYWGDRNGLRSAIVTRIPAEAFDIEESVPGVYIPFPKWTDPVIPSE